MIMVDIVRILPDIVGYSTVVAVVLWYQFTRAKLHEDKRMYKTNVLFHGDENQGILLEMQTELFSSMHLDWSNKYLFGRKKYPKIFSSQNEFDDKFVVKLMSENFRKAIVNDPEVCRIFVKMANTIPNGYTCSFYGNGKFTIRFCWRISQKQCLEYMKFLDKEIPKLCMRINNIIENSYEKTE